MTVWSIMIQFDPKKSWKKLSLETVKKYGTNLKFVKIRFGTLLQTPFFQRMLCYNFSIWAYLW